MLETVGVRGGVAPLWPLHLQRLDRSSRNLGFSLPVQIARPSGGGDHVVRYAITADGVSVSGRPPRDALPLTLVEVPLVHQGYPDKTADREWLDHALSISRRQGAEDALLFDHNGFMVEAVNWAIGWWEGNGVAFPPLSLGGLRSVSRRRIGELVPASESRIHAGELSGRALIAANAARGVVPVGSLNGIAVPGDDRTRELQESFWNRATA